MSQHCPYAVPSGVPVYDVDLYTDEVIRDPYPHYAAMRELGPVVFLPKLGNYAVTRFAELREALRNWEVFSSAQGIAADQTGCEFIRGNSVGSDPPLHDTIRTAMAAPLMPGALTKDFRDQVAATASALIARLIVKQEFDGIDDLANYLPLTLVTDLVGLPEDGRENMLLWAASAFDITGVQNERGKRGLEVISDMRDWIITHATPDRLKPGSLTARIRDMIAKGEIAEDLYVSIMNDYITPSLDTTISAIGQLLYQLGRNPEQWALLQNDPSLIPAAVNEAVRMGSPIRSFSRTLTKDYELGGVNLPAGARAMMLFASANRDERKFPNPDQFDITRKIRDHVGFGHGIHLCVGMHLAKLEMESLLAALIDQAETIEVGTPTIVLNNTIHAFATLPVRLYRREKNSRAYQALL